MRASIRLIATLSSEISPRPPAWPSAITSAGRMTVEQSARALGASAKDDRQDRADHAVSRDRLAIEAARDFGRRIDRLAGERLETGNQDDRLAHRNTSRAIRATLTTMRARAVGICERITPYWSGSSSNTAGTMLKLAAIGVSSVPQ